MSVLGAGEAFMLSAADDAAYVIPKSLRFNSGDSAHLSRTHTSAGNRRTWTWSAWVKRSKLGERVALFTAATDNTEILFEPDDKLRIYFFPGSYAGHTKTEASFRDTAAWYHIVFAIDTTQTGNDNIAKIYVNGVQQAVTHPNNWTQNGQTNVNNTVAHYIGSRYGPGRLINAYMADVQLVDGQQLAPTAFGETRESDGVWVPKKASFTSLNNGTTWSSTLTLSSAHSSNTPASKGFDGEMGTGNTGFALTAGGGTIEWTASSYTFPANATVEVWKSNTGGNNLRYWNVDTGSGYGSNIAEDGNLGWLSLGTLSNIQKIRCVGTNVNGYGASWAGIRINGEVLLDGVSNKYGVNGFHLPFSDDSAAYKLGKDASSTDTALPCVDFDGNDHLQIAYHSDFDLGNGDFTIECFAKTTDATTNYPSIVGRWQGNGAAHWDFRPASDDASHNFFFIYHTGSANITVNSGTSITDGKWHHIAVARQSSNLRMFVDGVLVHTHNIGTSTISSSNSVPLYLGYDPYGSSYYNGQTSNLRIVKGTALYTATFTKPTTPLTNVTGTKLLCFQSDTSVTAAATTPNALTVSSGDPEARSVSDSDWSVNNLSVSDLISSGNSYNGSLNGYMPAGVAQATDPAQLADTSNRTHFFLVDQNNTSNITVVATATTMAVASSVYDGWGSNNPTTTLNNGATTPSSSGSDTSVTGKNLAVNYFQNLTIGNTYTISTKNGGAGNPHRIHYVTGATVQNQPVIDTDCVIDSPTSYEAESGNNGGNYATLNPLQTGSGLTLSNGNLDLDGTSGWKSSYSTIFLPTGKWYSEYTIRSITSHSYGILVGLAGLGTNRIESEISGGDEYAIQNGPGDMKISRNAGSTGLGSQSAYAVGDVLQLAYDADNGKLWFGKNGTYINSGNPSAGSNPVQSGISGTYCFAVALLTASDKISANFGARPFSFSPPTGFLSVCTQNLDDPLITKGSDYFDILTWAGDGPSGNRTITGLNMADAPDWVWAKERNGGSSHATFDAVRGFGSNNVLCTNNYNNEGVSNGGYVNSTTKSSVTFAQGTSTSEFYDANNKNYVAWCWDAGDLATNTTYNQDRVWSDGVTFSGTILEAATRAFDGNQSTSASPYDTSGGGGSNPWIQVTFNPGIPFTSSVKVERMNGNPTNHTVSFNGGTPINSVFQGYTTVATGSGTLTSIKVQNNGSTNTQGISRIEVDGKVLVDKGVIPVGSSNSAFYNQTQNWTGLYTTSSGSMQNPGGSFDGNTSTQSYILNATATWEVSTAFTVNDKVEIFFNNNSNTSFYITSDGSNWTEITGIGGATGWRTVMNSGSFKGFRTTQSDATSTSASVKAVRIDGVLLIDSGVSLSGFTQYPSIASSCRTNRTAGFSIVSWQGSGANASIGHNLNAQPAFMIVKVRNSSGNTNWCVYHKDLTSAAYTLALDSTYFAESNPTTWNSTDPTSSVFFTGTRGSVSESSKNIIGYIFSEVEGYSSFGKANTTGTAPVMCYTGFSPRWVLIKDTTASGPNWLIFDTERDPQNLASTFIRANSNLEEIDNQTANGSIDFLSNGFSIRASGSSSSNTTINIPNSSVVWAAFAEHPFKNARAR